MKHHVNAKRRNGLVEIVNSETEVVVKRVKTTTRAAEVIVEMEKESSYNPDKLTATWGDVELTEGYSK